MAKSFLRSGSLDDIQALGENGQPVYTSARQIRETLRLRKQQMLADVLAIPQPNEAGDRIDWYAPVAGKVTSWLSASDSERASAITQLEQCRAVVQNLCQAALKSAKPGQQLFGALLAKAIQFPDQNHVYLVDGRPVLAFWGFVHLDKKSRVDALDCLRPPVFKPENSLVDLPLPTLSRAEPVTPLAAPKAAAKVTPASQPEPAPASATKRSPGRGWVRFWWLIPGAALAATLVMQFTGAFAPAEQATAKAPAAPVVAEKRALPATDAPAVQPQVIAPPPVAEDKPLAVANAPAAKAPELPVKPAIVTPAAQVVPEPAAPAAAPPVISGPEDKNALTMPTDAVKVGSTKFLNGNWRAVLDIKTPITGKPPSLRYQIKNGKGTAKIEYGDGMTCKADVSAGLMSSGNLVINSRFKAKCSDGSRYKMPEIVCTQPLNGIADCKGRYDGNTVFPMTMKRESK